MTKIDMSTLEHEETEQEIRFLEHKLAIAKAKLKAKRGINDQNIGESRDDNLDKKFSVIDLTDNATNKKITNTPELPVKHLPAHPQNLHLWLLLADSALPIGSFAFSSGLESYIAHRTVLLPLINKSSLSSNGRLNNRAELDRFLRLSLRSTASMTIPYVRAAFLHPETAVLLDDQFDACNTCTVARRASVSQGRALLTVWEKSLRSSLKSSLCDSSVRAMDAYASAIRGENKTYAFGHYGVAWGVACRAAGMIPLASSSSSNSNSTGNDEALNNVLFVFLFNHVKAVLSAAVRQSLIGPYVAQAILASNDTRALIWTCVEAGRRIAVEDAGQTVPTLDMYQGRHEILYSRVFNS